MGSFSDTVDGTTLEEDALVEETAKATDTTLDIGSCVDNVSDTVEEEAGKDVITCVEPDKTDELTDAVDAIKEDGGAEVAAATMLECIMLVEDTVADDELEDKAFPKLAGASVYDGIAT